MTSIQNGCLQNQEKKRKDLKSSAPTGGAVVKAGGAVVKAVGGRSGVTAAFSFLRQTGFDKVAQGVFLVFQAAPSDVSSWMFGDTVMLGDVYYRCEPRKRPAALDPRVKATRDP